MINLRYFCFVVIQLYLKVRALALFYFINLHHYTYITNRQYKIHRNSVIYSNPDVWSFNSIKKHIRIHLGEVIMRKRIIAYRKRIDNLILKLESEIHTGVGSTKESKTNRDTVSKDESAINIDRVIEEHLVQIAFFQHERLIHLIVTVAFALMTIISIVASVLAPADETMGFLILTASLIILLVPYILHYYILENETQKMYEQYDKLLEIKSGENM